MARDARARPRDVPGVPGDVPRGPETDAEGRETGGGPRRARTCERAPDPEARRALGHVVVGEDADGARNAAAQEIGAVLGEDPEQKPVVAEEARGRVSEPSARSSGKKNGRFANRATARPCRLFLFGKRPFVESSGRDENRAATHLKTLHLLGPNAQTWLDASSMLMNRLRASFHLSCPESGFKGSFPAPPFCVRPCFPKRWIAERMGPAHPLAQRARVTGSHALSPPSSVKGAPFKPSAGV